MSAVSVASQHFRATMNVRSLGGIRFTWSKVAFHAGPETFHWIQSFPLPDGWKILEPLGQGAGVMGFEVEMFTGK